MDELLKLCDEYSFKMEIEKNDLLRGVTIKISDPINHLRKMITLPHEDIKNINNDMLNSIFLSTIKDFGIDREDA